MNSARGLIFLTVVILVLWGVTNKSPSPQPPPQPPKVVEEKKAPEPPPPPPTPEPGQPVTVEYFNYLQRSNTIILVHCMTEIRKLVKYDIRAPGILWGQSSGSDAILRFTHFSRHVADDGSITVGGDDAEAQNGIGNWLRVNYTCTIDLGTNTVKRVTLDSGRLP
jgi:hypothetical protein